MSKKEKETAGKAAPELNEVVLKIAKTAEATYVAKEGGIIVSEDKDLYEKTLPEGVDMALIRKQQEHDGFFVTGTLHGAAPIAAEQFAKNPELQSCTLRIQAGKSRIDHVFNRDGSAHSGFTVAGTGGTGGNYKRVLDHYAELVKRTLA